MSTQKIIIKCPQCKKEVEYSLQNKNRPFCSDRCKLIDLGAWAEEKYAVPVEDIQTAMEEFEQGLIPTNTNSNSNPK